MTLTLVQLFLGLSRTCLSEYVSHEEFGGETGADDDVSLAADLSVKGAGEGGGVLIAHAANKLQLVELSKLSRIHFLQTK